MRARRPSDVAAEAERVRHNIGRNARRLRGDRTRPEVAAAAAISTVMLYRIETGRRLPSLETLVHLAGALGLPNAAYLLLPPPLGASRHEHPTADWWWAYLGLSGPGKREAQRYVVAMARNPTFAAELGRTRPRRLQLAIPIDVDADEAAPARGDEPPGGRGVNVRELEHDRRDEREAGEQLRERASGQRVTSSSWSGGWPPVRWSGSGG